MYSVRITLKANQKGEHVVSKFFRRIFGTSVIGIMSLVISSTFTMTAFAASPGDVGAWTNTTPLPIGLAYTNSVIYNGYIYKIGGSTGVEINTVYSAPLNSNGNVGAWVATTPLPQNLSNSTSVVYNGYVYVMGGTSDSFIVNTVYSAPLNLNGTIGVWATSANTLPQTLNATTSIVYNGYIYVMGGFNGSRLNTVYSAPVNNGAVGAWATSPNSLPKGLQFASTITHDGYAYIMGGLGSIDTYSDTVYSAPLGANGTIGAWATSPNSLPQALFGHTTVSYNDYAYVMGGYASGEESDAVYSAPLGANGTIGAWATSPNSLPQALWAASAVTANGFVYNIGGTRSNEFFSDIYCAQLTGYLPPSSSSQSASVSSGLSVTVDVLAGVSGNPDPSTLQIITGPVHGTATILGGNITYTAAVGYVGSDSLVFQVCSLNDASMCTQSTLSFTVTAAVIIPSADLESTDTTPDIKLEPTVTVPNTGLEPASYMPAAITIISGIGLIIVAKRRYL